MCRCAELLTEVTGARWASDIQIVLGKTCEMGRGLERSHATLPAGVGIGIGIGRAGAGLPDSGPPSGVARSWPDQSQATARPG